MSSYVDGLAINQKRELRLSRGFWGGVALATPFLAEFFSWRWVVWLAVPLIVAFACRVRIKRPHLAVLPMLALVLLHAIALAVTDTAYFSQVVKDLVIASFLFLIYLLADEDALDGFFFVIIPLALGAAVIGLVKAALLDRGVLLGFIMEGCSYTPAGSALCVNYNNLGLLWLVAALGCMRSRLWWVVAVLVAAGALSSSRRFIVLMAFLPVVWILIQGRSAVLKSILVGLLSTALVYVVSDPASFEKFRFGHEPYTVLNLSDLLEQSVAKSSVDDGSRTVGVEVIPEPVIDVSAFVPSSPVEAKAVAPEVVVKSEQVETLVAINRSTPGAMLGTLADGTAGTASRMGMWELGISLLSWLPQGWTYHKVFSCTFSACSDFYYPHMPVIAEWIIGGVVFGLVAIAFYAWPFWLVWRRKEVLPIALFMVAMPYSLISGDTVFSLPTCLACMFVALSSVARPNPRGTP